MLSNLVNGDILRICVLTQYKSHSLDRHITTTWRMSSLLGNYVPRSPPSSVSARAGTWAARRDCSP